MMLDGRLSELYGKDDKEDRDEDQGIPGTIICTCSGIKTKSYLKIMHLSSSWCRMIILVTIH